MGLVTGAGSVARGETGGADEHREHGEHREDGAQSEHREHGGVASGSRTSVVSFHARFPTAGLYKSWAQFQHRGRVVTVPFVIQVGGGSGHHADADHHDH